MVLTLGLGPTKPSRGVRFAQARSPSRYIPVHSFNFTLTSDYGNQVYADATLVFPLLVAATFARDVQKA